MSFRTKLFPRFLVTVLASVSVVAYRVTPLHPRRFRRDRPGAAPSLVAHYKNSNSVAKTWR